MADYPIDARVDSGVRDLESKIVEIEQAWNELRSTLTMVVPTDEEELAAILAAAIISCSSEVEAGDVFEAETAGRFVFAERHAADNSVGRLLAGVCNKGPQGGALGRQIEEVERRAGEHTPVIVRSTAFPANPKAAVSQQLGKLIARGGRRVVVEDSDWRTMMALAVFRTGRGIDADPAFVAWLKRSRPLTGLTSLRAILDLDRRPEPTPTIAPTPAEPSVPSNPAAGATTVKPPEPSPPLPRADRIVIGTTSDRRGEPVAIDPAELTRHAAFLGAPGSGKTTAALGVVEQLLVQGIPAILIDRKGDLCAYARPDLGLRAGLDRELAARAETLRSSVEVALYTPRRPDGRPLSIAAVPAGLGALPSHEREQAAKFAATALADMMNYGDNKRDQSCLAILIRAIELLSQEPRAAISIQALVNFIAEKDPALINVVGHLDVKLFDRLVQDLETLRHIRGDLLAAEGEPLDVDALLGRGLGQTSGKTRLSIISTKFLGTNQDVQFWVSQLLMAPGALDQQVARAGRDTPGGGPLRRGRPVSPGGATTGDQGADGAPAEAGAIGRPGPTAGHPEPRRFRLQVPRQHPRLAGRPGEGSQLDRQDEADAQRLPHRRRQPPALTRARRVLFHPRRRGHSREGASLRG